MSDELKQWYEEQQKKYDKRVEELEKTHVYHHTAAVRGYVSRRYHTLGDIEEYAERFGKGFKVHFPRHDTTNFHYVAYYIERKV